MFAMKPAGVGLGFARVPMAQDCTLESLAAMESEIDRALVGLMPARDDVNVITYNCTSGSLVIGEARMKEIISQARPGVRATTLMSGVTSALQALEATRIAVGTAYTDDINAFEQSYLESLGFDIVEMQGLGLMSDVEMNRVSPRFLRDFAVSLDRPDADVIFMSCGALRACDVIEEVEALTGKAFICSNQASMWHCLRLAGIDDAISGFGRLFAQH